ncbi:MAG TPA: sugar MFS transporter [Candidatus Sulfotelmatobacter sp.]|jgi:FHS family L-fucose permease-like MFS transporter|nr:sugar MFS transporter [Candidatus Sulfotelmatobacter sp.]
MAIAAPNTSTKAASGSSTSYTGALAVITTLFFMWGSLTSLNDVLIPYAQHVFRIKLDASMLIQTAFFSAYFVFSIPSSKIIDWIGYKKAIIVGLSTMIVACLAFYPAARIPSFPFFLVALVILATGITILQVAANPYVAVLGNPKTASSRLNLTQAFNSLGTTIFPWVGAHLILGTTATALARSPSQEADAVVKLYVYFFSLALLLLAVAIGLFKLPKMESAEHPIGEKVDDSIWKHPNLIFGAIGIFVYVGGEVAIGSSIANYLALDNIGGFISPSSVPDTAVRYRAALSEAAKFISLYWGGAMVGRFIGSALLQKIKTSTLLAFAAIMAVLLVAVSVLSNGHVAMWSILAVGLFNSIMFPCIFTMGIAELGPLTGDGSGLLNMAIVGGAIIPYLVGRVAVLINNRYYPTMVQGETSWGQGMHYALILPVLCYLYILFFALSGSRPNSQRYAKA